MWSEEARNFSLCVKICSALTHSELCGTTSMVLLLVDHNFFGCIEKKNLVQEISQDIHLDLYDDAKQDHKSVPGLFLLSETI